jgi:predicted transport protein
MAVWTCPACERTFGKANQGHTCAPALTEDEYFATGPAFERPIFEEVRDFLVALGDDVRVEFVSVGVFFKKRTTFASLRPLTKWSKLYAKTSPYREARLRTAADVTDEVRDWLVEAYEDD